VHESTCRYKATRGTQELAEALVALGQGRDGRSIEISKVLPGQRKRVQIQRTEPVTFKLLYAKEEDELEIHMELKWAPAGGVRPEAKTPSRSKRSKPIH